MPRTARKQSFTGIYHVVLRGIDRQKIFKDDSDYRKYISLLNELKSICGYELYAWCLMPNHIHILFKVGSESLDMIFRRIGVRFVYWYNAKYDRVGHLFQDRYKSEPVENESYLLTVTRYIHHNPLKAKLCSKLSEYKYSSYHDYIFNNGISDTAFLTRMIGMENFIEYHNDNCDDNCMEHNTVIRKRITDDQLIKIARDQLACCDVKSIRSFDKIKRRKAIDLLLDSGGSIRQISRLTGMTPHQVRGS